MLWISFAALTLGAVALVASGCGGSSSKTGSASTASAKAAPTTAIFPTTPAVKLASGKPLSRARWIAEGDAICARANTKLAPISIRSTADFGRLLPQIAIYTRAESAELSKLVPPRSMAHDWAQIVNDLRLYSAYGNAIARYALAKNDSAARPLFAAAATLHEKMFAIALRDGFRHCSHAR